MDNQRLIIWGTFGLLLWLTYQTWMTDMTPQPVAPSQTPQTATQEQPAIPDLDEASLPPLPQAG